MLALVESAGEVAVGQVMAALRVPRTTAWRALAALVEEGKIEAVGETKGRKYRIAVPNAAAPPAGAEDPRWAKVLVIARREGKVTRARVVEVLGVSESTAGRLLSGMVTAGALQASGSGCAAAYLPCRHATAAA